MNDDEDDDSDDDDDYIPSTPDGGNAMDERYGMSVGGSIPDLNDLHDVPRR